MRIVTYDCEVFAFDWLVVFKDKESGSYTVIHNDNETLQECMRDDVIYVSFNGKHYDSYIIKAICCGFSPQEVKAVNDFIIGGGQGWECPLSETIFPLQQRRTSKDDVTRGPLSLKGNSKGMGNWT